MKTGMIDSSRIEAMISQLKAAAARSQPAERSLSVEEPASKVNFSDALKSSLDQVSNSQNKAEQLGKNFAMCDDSVNLSDVMI